MENLKRIFSDNIRQYSMLIALVVIMVFFQIVTDGALMKPLNLTNLVLQNSYVVILALGMLLVIVAGNIDLSVGSVAAFSGAIAAVLIVNYKLNSAVAVLVCLAVGALIGSLQGYFIAYIKIPSFIATLAGMLIFRGLTLVLLRGQSIGPFPGEFQALSSGFIPDIFGSGGLRITTLVIGAIISIILIYLDVRSRQNQRKYGFEVTPLYFFLIKNLVIAGAIMGLSYLLASYNGLPNVLIVLGVLIALYGFVTTRTVIGRRVYALGGNQKAAKLSGVNTERLTLYTFINMGILAAMAGLIITARLNSATAKAGTGFELDAIAATFIGGASATGGIGTVFGAVIGAFIMGTMNNGMSILGVGIDWQQAIKGSVLLIAVFFDVYNKNKS
ncbi:multiple monosaccharide ABC transporter permease [Caldilinea sp.]|uniref:multiple monosaccharide ABC transporter permease n=1 Tax=Caldilinea sp. TaxID=2293560 RepID=UPI002D11CDB3|nr:sugar ABC transporter permease [Caldilinea sp.]